jgi:hypothetical protein
MRHGWGNGRFARALKNARGKAIGKLGRPNVVVLEKHGLVVVDRALLMKLLEAIRTHDDADLAERKAHAAMARALELEASR